MSAKHLKRFQFQPIPKEPPLIWFGIAIAGLLFVLDLLILHAPIIERL